MHCLWQYLYQVSLEYVEWFVSYGPRLKFLHDADDEDNDDAAKAMTIARLKTDELKIPQNAICFCIMFSFFKRING